MKTSTKAFLIVTGITSVAAVATIAVVRAVQKFKEDLSACVFTDIDFTGCDDCLRYGRDEDEQSEYNFSNATKSTYVSCNHYTTKDDVAEMIDEAMKKIKVD